MKIDASADMEMEKKKKEYNQMATYMETEVDPTANIEVQKYTAR